MSEISEIKHIEVSKIIPYEKNNKKHTKTQIEKLKASIEEFGFTNPILLDNENIIIAGHGRLKAAQELGMEVIPCQYISGLSDSQLKALRIADNRIADFAEIDWDNLKIEFEELKLEGLDNLTGFEDKDFDFLDQSSKEEIEEDEFEVEGHMRKGNKNKIQVGDVFQLGEHSLMCGDSTSNENVTVLLNGNKPVLMITDPHYGVNYDPNWRNEVDRKNMKLGKAPARATGKVKNDHISDWTEAYDLFPGNIAYVWHAGKYSSEVAQTLESSNFEIISQIIWAKPHFALSRGDYHWQHEPCWYGVRKGESHNWQGSRKEKTVWEIAGMNAMGGTTDPDNERTGHGTQKPLECMARPIKNNTAEGESCYDPFGGSGSTLIAAERLNRRCYMMELDPNYVQLIIDRFEKLTGKKAEKVN